MDIVNGISTSSTAELLKQKDKIQNSGNTDFSQKLKSAMNELNELKQESESAAADIATGQVKDLHQAALAINKAETSMKLMLEIRNKALNAYEELARTSL
jgi:flagellar hook-basal body complex protein FliE